MCWVNYDKIALSIKAAIDRRPADKSAYDDLFSLCRGWEAEDFAAAHALNKELIGMCAAQIRNGARKQLISMRFGERVCCLKHLTILTLS